MATAAEAQPATAPHPRADGPATNPGATRSWRTAARTYRWLLAIAAAGLLLRLLLVFVVHPLCPFDADAWNDPSKVVNSIDQQATQTNTCLPLNGDSLFVYLQGRMLADGHGFSDPVRFITTGETKPSGWKPPVLTVMVATLAEVGLTSPDAARTASAILGSGAIVILGWVAWQLAGRRAGLLTAAVAALHPVLWTNDWRLLTESPLAFVIALILLGAYRFWVSPNPRRALWLGLFIGLGGYCRAETPLLLLVLLAPLVFGLRHLRFSARFKLGLVAGFAGLAVIAPLWVFNAVRFNQTTVFTTGGGWGLKNGTCDSTWFGDRLGYLDFECFDAEVKSELLEKRLTPRQVAGTSADESDVDLVYRASANKYVADNLRRFPDVAAARVGRMWDLYRPTQNAQLNIDIEGRGVFDSWAGLLTYYLLLPFSVAGLVVLFRRRVTISPVVALAVIATLSAMLGFGLTRYRIPADVGLCLVAGIGLDRAWRRVTTHGETGARESVDDAPSRSVAAASRRASSYERIVTPRWLAIGAVGAAVVALPIVVWSAGVEPARSATSAVPAGSTPPPNGVTTVPRSQRDIEACAQIAQLNLPDIGAKVASNTMDAATEQRFRSQIEVLANGGPPKVQPAAQTIQQFLQTYSLTQVAGNPEAAKAIPPAATKSVSDATVDLLAWSEVNC